MGQRMTPMRALGHRTTDEADPTVKLGGARRVAVRALALLGLLSFGFMLVFVVSDAAGRIGEVTELVPPGSIEAQIGADHPGELVHVTGALATLAIGASALIGLAIRPQRAGSATQVGAVAVGMLLATAVVGNPDNAGEQASLVDPAFVILALPPLAASLAAAPWRAWQGRLARPRLLALATLGLPGVWYAIDQGLMQRNTWPPLADPRHQAHWYAISLLAFVTVLVVAAAVVPGRGWRMAAVTAGAGAAAVGIASLLAPTAASALHPIAAVAGVAWGMAVVAVSWRAPRRVSLSRSR